MVYVDEMGEIPTAIPTLYRVSFKDGVGVEHILDRFYTFKEASIIVDDLKSRFPGYNEFNIKKI